MPVTTLVKQARKKPAASQSQCTSCGVVCINMYDCSQDVRMCDIWGMCVIVDCVYVRACCSLSVIVCIHMEEWECAAFLNSDAQVQVC